MILIMYHKYQYFLYKINQSYFSESENDSYVGMEVVPFFYVDQRTANMDADWRVILTLPLYANMYSSMLLVEWMEPTSCGRFLFETDSLRRAKVN